MPVENVARQIAALSYKGGKFENEVKSSRFSPLVKIGRENQSWPLYCLPACHDERAVTFYGSKIGLKLKE